MHFEKLAQQGRMKVHDSLASSVTTNIVDIRNENLRNSFQNYFNRDHRLQFVASIQNVDFVDDAKAENINSTWYALEDMIKPVIWITGGNDMNCDYSKLSDLVRNKVKCIVYMGDNIDSILDNFQGLVDKIIVGNSMEDSVLKAFDNSIRGDVILLSPACPDNNYESFNEKGISFKKAVNKV
jgi:UDP-N-acetylmuramoylalanine--D-glutamate ligase